MDLQAIEARLEAAERSPFGFIPSEDIRALIAEVERLTAQIDAVKALHFPADLKLYAATVKVCATCEVHEWPCPTMLALGVTE